MEVYQHFGCFFFFLLRHRIERTTLHSRTSRYIIRLTSFFGKMFPMPIGEFPPITEDALSHGFPSYILPIHVTHTPNFGCLCFRADARNPYLALFHLCTLRSPITKTGFQSSDHVSSISQICINLPSRQLGCLIFRRRNNTFPSHFDSILFFSPIATTFLEFFFRT